MRLLLAVAVVLCLMTAACSSAPEQMETVPADEPAAPEAPPAEEPVIEEPEAEEPADGDQKTATMTEVSMSIEGGGATAYTATLEFEDGTTAEASVDLPEGSAIGKDMEVVAEMRGGEWVVVSVKD